jgi:hypothetical protein
VSYQIITRVIQEATKFQGVSSCLVYMFESIRTQMNASEISCYDHQDVVDFLQCISREHGELMDNQLEHQDLEQVSQSASSCSFSVVVIVFTLLRPAAPCIQMRAPWCKTPSTMQRHA